MVLALHPWQRAGVASSTNDVVIVPISLQLIPELTDAPITYPNLLDGVINRDIDILNRSFGIAREAASDGWFVAKITGAFRAAAKGTPQRNYWESFAQAGVASAEKTVQVLAAGNESDNRPSEISILPYYLEELRDHWVAVVATGSDGAIAYYSNHCGERTMTDIAWDETAHGLHYCLAAAGEGKGEALPNGQTRSSGVGTSFAAPRVTGAIATVMSNARGQIHAVEALSRVKETADRSGMYADETNLWHWISGYKCRLECRRYSLY